MTDSLAKPFLEDLLENHTVVGETLRIICQVKSSVGVDINFTIPGIWVRIIINQLSKILIISKLG